MNREGAAVFRQPDRVPHVRGDEPAVAELRNETIFAFPTCVGMNRPVLKCEGPALSVPHVRGDEPVGFLQSFRTFWRSPRAWG